jgi:serine/threonine protein kinase
MSTTTMTVQGLCAALAKSRLLSADDVRAVYQRWQASGANLDDVEAFRKHLVRERLVTEYQVALLLRGHTDGFILGAYKILDKIGKGRMAGVYRAQHLTSGQIVALKVLPPSKAKDPQMLARFTREGRMLTQLNHPHLVHAIELAQEDEYNFIVMEYLEGDTLDEVLAKRGQLPVGEAARIAQQTLLGLQAIADAGMVHRDIKPANLMLVPGMQAALDYTTLYSTVKILDLGLGRAVFEEGEDDNLETQLTSDGMLLGTPDYLAPEQARNARAVDIRADLYSLGCVLYHMLSGRPPFPGTNVMQQIIDHASKPAVPLPQINPQVPEGLWQVVSWLMAKDPNQRCPTPSSAVQALAAYVPVVPPAGLQSAQAGGSMRLRGKPAAASATPLPPPPPPPPPFPPLSPAPPLAAAASEPPASPPPRASDLAPTQAYTPLPPPGLMATEIHQVPPLPPGPKAGSIPVGKLEAPPKKPKRGKSDAARPGTPTVPAGLEEVELDVELVSADSLPALAREFPKTLEELDRRDYLMLAIGGAGVGLSMLLGYALVRLITGRSTRPTDEEKTEGE